MKRGRSNLFLASMVAVLLIAVPITNAYFSNDSVLAIAAKLLLLPGTVLVRPFDSTPDLPMVVFVSWVLYTMLTWPMLMLVRPSR